MGDFTGSNQELLALLGRDSLAVEQLLALTKRSLPELLGELTELELAGMVVRDSSGGYTRTRKK
jgi:predicted Rossmann fold nucleotide-binding protein DprA/Smf involved in DNA uptake